MFIETPRFPDAIARNMRRRRRAGVTTVTYDSGYEQHIVRWAQKRREYDVGFAVRTESDYAAVSAWWDALDGPADGFRVRDHADYRATSVDGLLRPLHGTAQVGTAGFGYGVPSYQLVKRYAVGAKTHDRDVRKPVAGTVSLRRAGAAVTFGAAPGNAALDTTTGIVTFVADATRSIAGVTVGATTQITVSGTALPGIAVGDRIYLTGLSGADAALLNDLSHQVTAIAGLTYTVATNTAGKTITASGNAHAYPQADEALDWAGEFDVPVRFAQDELGDLVLQRNAGGELLIQVPEITLIEIRV